MKWKNISIFISSTFNDMQSERDYIRKFIVPRLNEALSTYQIHVQVTDLRWGIDTHETEESEREAKVLHVCMESIKKTRPYFIALLGERYGWVPSETRTQQIIRSLPEEDRTLLSDVRGPLSVTELEIIFGALCTEDMLSNSFFCFRSPSSYRNMSAEELARFVDSSRPTDAAGNQAQKLAQLKDKIVQTCRQYQCPERIIPYQATWNPADQKFHELEEFGEQLYQRLLDDIKNDYEKQPEERSSTEEELLLTTSFFAANYQEFQGRQSLLRQLTQFILDNRSAIHLLKDGTNGLFLSGDSGSGKSFLLSALYYELSQLSASHHLIILPHAAGISPKSTKASEMIRNWTYLMNHFLHEDQAPEQDSLPVTVAHFQQQLLQLQTQGYFPVILIDSLDSFQPQDIPGIFDYIPYNTPFICTTLPGYADNLLKKHPNYRLRDIDSFSREDALSVIEQSLRNNSKELSENLKNEIISLRDEQGVPAYTSPFWVKMCMSILMELGAEDFQEIHKEQFEKEDCKIEAYLHKVIQSLPPTPAQLFEYFLQLTSQYFDAAITQKSLTLIALSRYGASEQVLSELIGDSWNLLEFTSLRYWLRDFIRRYGNSDKWTFTHQILKNILLHQDEAYVTTCKNQYFDYLLNHIGCGTDEDELISQIIQESAYETLHRYAADQEDHHYTITRAFEREASDNQAQVADFLDHYLSHYYTEDALWIEQILYTLTQPTDEETLVEQVTSKLQLCRLPFKYFTEQDIYGGNSELLSLYFQNHQLLFDTYDYLDDSFDQTEAEFLKLKAVYFKNKEMYGADILSLQYVYHFYYYWSNYLRKLERKSRYTDAPQTTYKQNFEELLQETEWFADHIYAYFKKFELYHRIFGSHFRKNNYCLSTQEMKEYADRIFADFQRLKPHDDSLVYYEQTAQNMKEKYEELFLQPDSIPAYFTNTALPEDEDTQDDLFTFVTDDETEEPHPDGRQEINFEEEIEAALHELNQYVSEHPLPETTGKSYSDILNNYYQKMKTVADLYYRSGDPEKSFDLMKSAGTLIIRTIHNQYSNYVIEEDGLENIIDLSHWYAQKGCEQAQIDLLEATSYALWQLYYHHIDGDAPNTLLNELIDIYEKNGMTDQKITLQEQMFDFCFRHQLERNFNSYDYTFKDLSYVRPVYRSLFHSLKQAHEIEKAVILLEKWLELCDMTYVDEKDTGYGYDDYDETYDNLAELYDGTPTLVQGMQERQSVFLRDPYLLVSHQGKWGYLHHDGSVHIPCIYDRGWRADGELLSVCQNGRWGYLTLSGDLLVNFQLDVATPPHEGYSRLMSNGYSSIFSKTEGVIPIETDCERYYDFKDGLLKVQLPAKYQYHQDLLLPDGITLMFQGQQHTVYTPNQGVIVTRRYEDGDPVCALYDEKGHSLLPADKTYTYLVPFGNNHLTPAGDESRVGFIDRSGNEVIPAIYSDVRPFHEGIAAVSLPGRDLYHGYWGFIDETGREILPIKYNNVGDFHEGLAWVCRASSDKGFGFQGCKYGFINRQGELVIPFLYDNVSSFWHGKALVFLHNQYYYINLEGKQIE